MRQALRLRTAPCAAEPALQINLAFGAHLPSWDEATLPLSADACGKLDLDLRSFQHNNLRFCHGPLCHFATCHAQDRINLSQPSTVSFRDRLSGSANVVLFFAPA
jgi:hypothetical protein